MQTDTLFERVEPLPPKCPNPWFPMLPVLGVAGRADESVAISCRFSGHDAIFTSSGSAAIHLALSVTGVCAGDSVAVPAYHCPSMIAPILAIGATPLFIPVGEDLSVSASALANRTNGRTKAVILPHYFGVAQRDAVRIRGWCDETGAVLVEDCAHAFLGESGSFIPGHIGHFAIASVRKFFAGIEGGVLVSNSAPLRLLLTAPGMLAEIRCCRRMFADSMDYGAIGLPILGGRRRRIRFEGPDDEAASLAEAAPARLASAEVEHVRDSHRAPRCMTRRIRESEMQAFAAVRRRRYARWQQAMRGVARARGLFDALPDCGVPYVFPVLLTHSREQFRALKYSRLQAWRWDRLAVSDCSLSRKLGAELIQLPCCQSLSDSSFEELVERVCETLDAQ